MNLNAEQFAKACGATPEIAAKYFDHAAAAMERFKIASDPAIAAFCATLSVETARLTTMEEDLYYKSPERLAQLFRRVFDQDGTTALTEGEIKGAMPYCRNPKGLSMLLYKGYHGRGGAQLTWERNYAHQAVKLDQDYLAKPELLLEPEHAMLTAASFYDDIKGNQCCEDMSEFTRRWNGPKRLHLAERIAQYNVALTVLA